MRLVSSTSSDFLIMSRHRSPIIFPSRNSKDFPMNMEIPDRQLWAIGMIVTHWSALEWFIDINVRNFIAGDQDAIAEYEKHKNFQQRLELWKTQISLKAKEPHRSRLLSLVPRLQSLSAQRDEIVHRMWAGGSPVGNDSTADAGLMPKPGEKIATNSFGGQIPFKWKADYHRLKRVASEISLLTRDLLVTSMAAGPPHMYVDTGNKVGS
jgi:hypothetical protein